MIAYRIADARFPIFDATGAMLAGGRWNSVGQRVIYAAESYAGAMLEKLVHANMPVPPKNQAVVQILIPDAVRIETVGAGSLPGWDGDDVTVPRTVGDRWLREMRTAVLRVPSVVTEGRENNLLLNPAHEEFGLIRASEPEAIRWDLRLFNRGR